MEFALLGWPADGPTLNLDHREFSYAGKFVMSNTGKAVAREAGKRGSDAARTNAEEGDDGDGSDDSEEDNDSNDGDDSEDGEIVAAAAFNEDRTDASVCWIRYVTVRHDRRGEGIGPRLLAFVAARAGERDHDRGRIAVNNPFAYQALYRAGFHFTGEATGMAELVLDRPLTDAEEGGAGSTVHSTETYQEGLDRFRDRDLSEEEMTFLEEKRGADPPDAVDPPT